MTDRITRGHVESAFRALCREAGKRQATAYNDVGAWFLDKGMGGYVIEEIITEGGGVRRPISDRRLPARAAYETFWFAQRAIEESKRC